MEIKYSGGRLCTLIGVPWWGVSFSTLSMGRFVLKQHICEGAESAEHAETAGYTYEGTQTTAWVSRRDSVQCITNKARSTEYRKWISEGLNET